MISYIKIVLINNNNNKKNFKKKEVKIIDLTAGGFTHFLDYY